MKRSVVSTLLAACLLSGPLAAAEATGRIEFTVVVPARFGALEALSDAARRVAEPLGERSVTINPEGYCAEDQPCRTTVTADYH